jgi:hypothetical protein
MNDLVKVDVLDLRPGDRVHERNADWPQPFSQDEVYIYTVETVERVNADTVNVGIVGGDTPSSIIYEPGDQVTIEPRTE